MQCTRGDRDQRRPRAVKNLQRVHRSTCRELAELRPRGRDGGDVLPVEALRLRLRFSESREAIPVATFLTPLAEHFSDLKDR